jgi:Protein of unknown function (DUF2934)
MPKTPRKVAMRGAPRSAANDTTREQSDEIASKSHVDVPQQESRLNQIARRAHEIYEARGGNHGKALEDWLQAEREIDDAMGDTEG